VRSDEDGEATVITESHELQTNTWLAGTLTKGGHTHFWYYSKPQGMAPSVQYVRIAHDESAPLLRTDLSAAGQNLRVLSSDGFFATRGMDAESPLHVVLKDTEGRVACLRSNDNGASWLDHAVATHAHHPYAVSGNPRIGDDGVIMGAYTAKTGSEGEFQIWFFRIPVF
jgi:hypothetical protein